ncbi:His/Gly/Thr/Pro-type tRNA ligase C-terminal domain-containing protein [Clostridium sp. Marseille-QA1073]
MLIVDKKLIRKTKREKVRYKIERIGYNLEGLKKVIAGVQFADADLLGVPLRIIVSERNIKTNQLEITTRDKKIKKIIQVEDLEREIEEIYSTY